MTTKQKEIQERKGFDSLAVRAYRTCIAIGAGDEELENFEEAYEGKWGSDEEFVQELLEEVGTIPNDLPFYVHIDWTATARDVMMDYTEQDGYYFRNL